MGRSENCDPHKEEVSTPEKSLAGTSADIIRDHIEHLIKRLTRQRAPLLHFHPNKSSRLDIYSMFKGIDPNVPVEEGKPRPITCITPEEFVNTFLNTGEAKAPRERSVVHQIRRMIQVNEDYSHRTGRSALYLGYPHIRISARSRRPVFAPLLLWPIKIKIATSRSEITFTRESEWLPNRLLKSWLQHEKERGLEFNHEDMIKEHGDSLELKHLRLFVEKLVENWNCEKKNFMDNPVSQYRDDDFSVEARLEGAAIIGYDHSKNQSLLQEMLELQKVGDKIRDTILGPYTFSSGPSESNEENEEAQDQEHEEGRWDNVVESDPSQDGAVKQAKKSPITVIQGPPGTGKSQTIVNIIASSLSRNEKVAVVCDHKAALDIIEKRMGEAELSDLVLKITDPEQQRKLVIQKIENERDWSVDSRTQQEWEETGENIKKLERQIESYEKAVNYRVYDSHPKEGRYSYANIRALLEQKRKGDLDIYEAKHKSLEEKIESDLPDNLREVDSRKKEIWDLIKRYNECAYAINRWREIKIGARIPPLEERDNPLRQLGKMAEDIISDSLHASLHSGKNALLFETPILNWVALAFLKPDLRAMEKKYIELIRKTKNFFHNLIPDHLISEAVDGIRQGKNLYGEYVEHHKYLEEVKETKEMLMRNSLRPFYEYEEDRPERWIDLLEALTCKRWLKDIRGQTGFRDIPPQEEIDRLRCAIEEKRKLDRTGLRSRFAPRIQYREKMKHKNLLRLKASRRAPRATLRSIYHKGFEEITKLYPVLLTNPDSASQILPLRAGLFDLIIIDEASQMFMADAMPTLYRAKRAVISGDIMQMPPSDYFGGNVDEEGNYEEIEGESETAANENRNIPADGEYELLKATDHAVDRNSESHKRLLVHYRSNHRQLIDFSNHAYYDRRLRIPDGNKKVLKWLGDQPMRYERVPGQFTQGINEHEADSIIDILREIWKDDNPPSVGVIVFNVRQSDLLNRRIFDIASEESEFHKILNREKERVEEGEDMGFFVRSVEHVQGDERDMIILGTTYDQESRRYGPLNRKEWGRRRLNVAVTRAKEGMIVVSSLDPEGIASEADREQREAWYLQQYLLYARAVSDGEVGAAKSLLRKFSETLEAAGSGAAESPFEREVGDWLREEGFQVDCQIGTSGFRIDLGLKGGCEDRLYLCGIECDGKTYHSLQRVQDRDIWRQGVLEGKGWKILRIWSEYWFRQPDETKRRILEKIRNLRKV